MKLKFTYKEFSLLVGIVVAIIIMLTLWLRPAPDASGEVSGKMLPKLGTPSASGMIKKIAVTIQDSLR
jgi:hypothetical protein